MLIYWAKYYTKMSTASTFCIQVEKGAQKLVNLGLVRMDSFSDVNLPPNAGLTLEYFLREFHMRRPQSITNGAVTCCNDVIILYIDDTPSLFITSGISDLSEIVAFYANQVAIEDLPFGTQNFVYYFNNRISATFDQPRAGKYNVHISLPWAKFLQIGLFIGAIENQYGPRYNYRKKDESHSSENGSCSSENGSCSSRKVKYKHHSSSKKAKENFQVTRSARALWAYKWKILAEIQKYC